MADEAKEAPAKKSPLKWIILALLLLGLGGGGYFAYLKFFAEAPAGDKPEAPQNATTPEGEPDLKGDSTVVTLPTFLVNLADPLGRRYLKLSVDVQVVGMETPKKLEADMPQVRDSVILLLSSKSYADLSTMEGKILLKKEIVERLNQVLGGPYIQRVYFTELVIQ